MMENHPYPDLIINGASNAAGGHYRNVRFEGMGKVIGDTRAEDVRINGMITVQGDLETERLDAEGKFKIEGRLSAAFAEIDGMTEVQGSLSGEHVTVKGLLKVHGDCELERFEVEGGFETDGMLNAGFVDISMYGRVKVKEIGCETIRVRKLTKTKWAPVFQRMFTKLSPLMHTDTIEGDEIDLEYTEASIVRGNRVVIGPGCRIGRVEYRSELRKHPGAHVGEERKSGDGSGLA